MSAERFLDDVWTALGGARSRLGQVRFGGVGTLPSIFPVGDLAAGSIAAAALAVAEYAASDATVRVDRRLASLWFGASFQPIGWRVPPAWDPITGDYESADGWIRLHANAPHHRAAALAVLNAAPEKGAVSAAVRTWSATALESAVVRDGGCAAAMKSRPQWSEDPQGAAVAAEPLVWLERGTGEKRRPAHADSPLRGIRVLDLTRVLAGPVATRFLAGFGADVLRIDPPDWDEPSVVPDVTLGKRCARLDIRMHRERFLSLLAEADVVVHGLRPGAMERLGLGGDVRRAVRPSIVDVSLDAYGWTGPWAGRRGFDSLVQMSAGIAHDGMVASNRDRPTPLPVQALDHATGYMMAAAVVRGLEDGGTTSRLSLARTADLLYGIRSDVDGSAMTGPGDADFSTQTESTAWGLGRRLAPAVGIGKMEMRWNGPAVPLGSRTPSWV